MKGMLTTATFFMGLAPVLKGAVLSPEENLPLGCSKWQQVNWILPWGVCILLSTLKGAGKSCLEQGWLACVVCLYVIRCASEL